uniref:Uncharacterized protein n=1 Tax=Arundo donax TaxID=35708 RepID=A0A0A9G1U5_ARUDO
MAVLIIITRCPSCTVCYKFFLHRHIINQQERRGRKKLKFTKITPATMESPPLG